MLIVSSNTFRYLMPGYDTVNLWLPKEQVSNINLFTEISPLLTNAKDSYCRQTYSTGTLGSLKNLRVIIKEQGVYITGSICKYFLNDNLQTLDLKQTKEAIAMLSDTLHLPLHNADVTRIDIAENLAMEFNVPYYFPYLGLARFYKRLEQPNGIDYQTGKRTMAFYGKLREMKSKGLHIPETIRGQNILRYELRFKKRLCQQFNRPELKAYTICEEEFYNSVLTRWHDEYFKINKYKDPNFDTTKLSSVKDLKNQLMLAGIKAAGGEAAILKLIEQAQKQGAFENKMQPSRLKEAVKEICSNTMLTFESDAIVELDRKVKAASKRQ